MNFSRSSKPQSPFARSEGNHWACVPDLDRRDLEVLRERMAMEIDDLARNYNIFHRNHPSCELRFLDPIARRVENGREVSRQPATD